jgi:hypothetical protein
VDRQPNYRLGRNTGQLPLFEHRRQILRAIAYPYANTDSNSYSHADTYTDPNSQAEPDTDTHSYAYLCGACCHEKPCKYHSQQQRNAERHS